jgi:L-ascorbate metabolism protein UlaG (beta-lactamase superfamily)
MFSRTGRRCGTNKRLSSRHRLRWLAMALLAGLLVDFLAKDSIAPSVADSFSPAAAAVIDQHHGALDPARWPKGALTIANLGHSTLLMNFFGVRVITDPSLFEQVGLNLGPLTIGPHRLARAPLNPPQLQQIDLILITHAHMDHLDLRSLRALPKSAVVVACRGCATLIAPLGYSDVRELQWGERTTVNGLTVTAMGANHWGKRWPWGRTYGFNSYLLEKSGHRMLLACDSAMTHLFAALYENPPQIAAFSIGAYDPWIWNHADPEQVWTMFGQTGAYYLVPLHWGTFRLSKEPMDEPLRRLIAAAGPDSNRIVLRQIGVAWTLPQGVERGALMHASR